MFNGTKFSLITTALAMTLATALATALAMVSAYSFPAAADVSISYSGAQQATVFHIGGQKLAIAIDIDGESADGGLLYDLASDKIYAIQHSEKQYIEMDEMMQQAMGMKSQMQQMLEAQMKSMSEAEKAQMKSMVGGLLGGLMGDKEKEKSAEQPKAGYDFTGEKVTVGGYVCEKVDMTLGTGEETQACVAPAKSLGISGADEAVLHGMMKKLSGLSEQMSQISGQYSFGFVGDFKQVLVKSYAEDQMQLMGVGPLSVSAGSLEIPAGYTKAEMSPY